MSEVARRIARLKAFEAFCADLWEQVDLYRATEVHADDAAVAEFVKSLQQAVAGHGLCAKTFADILRETGRPR